jgi:plastocyanin
MLVKRCGPLLIAALLLLLLPARASADQEITISAADFTFEPATISVNAGDVVHFTVTNNGQRPHNVEFELEAADVEKKLFDTNLQGGETRTVDYTFEQAGTWVMYCPVGSHRSQGMEGTAEVAEASGY